MAAGEGFSKWVHMNVDLITSFCCVVGVLLSLHSFVVHAALRSKYFDDILELKCIASEGWRGVVRETYLGAMHVLSLGAMIAGLYLFVSMALTTVIASQPSTVCTKMRPFSGTSNLLPELVAGVDEFLGDISINGKPKTADEVLTLSVDLVSHVGLVKPCNASRTGRLATLQAGEKCSQTTQLAGWGG